MRVAKHDLPGEKLRILAEHSIRYGKASSSPPSLILAAALFVLTPLPLLAPGALADSGEGPLPPLALTADTTNGDVTLSWYAPPVDVDGYRVYRADSAEAVAANGLDAFVAIGETTALTFVDIGSHAESNDPAFRAIYFATALLEYHESLPSNLASGQYPACWDIFTPTDCFIP